LDLMGVEHPMHNGGNSKSRNRDMRQSLPSNH